jgi:hypothetical protein
MHNLRPPQFKSLIYGANNFASSAINAENLIHMNLFVSLRKVKRSSDGTNVEAVSTALRTFFWVKADYPIKRLANTEHTFWAFKLADSAAWATLLIHDNVDLKPFPLLIR